MTVHGADPTNVVLGRHLGLRPGKEAACPQLSWGPDRVHTVGQPQQELLWVLAWGVCYLGNTTSSALAVQSWEA